MKPTRLNCWLALSLLLAGSLPAATPLFRIASEDAAVVLAVHDVPSLLAEWDHSPWAKTWNDEQVKRYFAPLREQMSEDEWGAKLKEKTGHTLNELLAFATGDAIFVVPNIEFAASTPPAVAPVLLAIEVGEHAEELEAMLLKTAKDENAVDETSDFAGVMVHSLQPAAENKPDAKPGPPTVWALVDGKWLASPSKEAVLTAIDAIHNGGARNPWEQSERYLHLQQRGAAGAHLVLSINAETIYPTIKAIVIERSKADAQAGPMKLDPEALLNAMGFDALREIYFTAELKDDVTVIHGGVTYSEAKGLLKVMAYRDGPPPTPAFVSAKWRSISSVKFSVKDAYAAIEEMLENFNPAISGLFQGQLRAFNKQLGIDLKRDLLGSLGDSLVATNVPPADLPEGDVPPAASLEPFIAVSLENPVAFTKALQALRGNFGAAAENLFKERDYLGEKIVTFQAPGQPNGASPKGVHYTITKGYFLMTVGSGAPLETALQTLTGGQPTIWQKPELKEVLAQLPANASGFSFEDVRVLVGNFFQSLTTAATLVNNQPAPVPVDGADSDAPPAKPAGPTSKIPVDPTAQPDLATIGKYWDYSWSQVTRDSSGIYGTAKIVYPK